MCTSRLRPRSSATTDFSKRACGCLERRARRRFRTPGRSRSWARSHGRGRIRRRHCAGQGKFAANGNFEDNLAFADRDKERTFIDSIVNGPVHNQIAAGVETALSCMLGRMAGLRRREVTWEELEAHGETYKLGMNLDSSRELVQEYYH